MPLKVGEYQKISMIKTLRAYGESVKEAMGFGTWKDRQELRVALYKKQGEEIELTEHEQIMLELLERIDKANGLKFCKDYVEKLEFEGELHYSLSEETEEFIDQAEVML
jgi:hypothetical protein